MNLATLERQVIAPAPVEKPKPGEHERWSWDTPVVLSSFDPAVVYTGSNVLFRSTDRGATWKAISPDLTANIDRETLKMMGALVPKDALSRHDGQAAYGTLTAIAESPLDAKVLYTGSDDGQLQVTRDLGATWTNLTSKVPGLPPNTYVSSVLASRHAAGRVYATFDGHYNDDYKPYVYVSEDYGRTWRSIAAGLPETSVHRLREHPRNGRLLFVGTRARHRRVDRRRRVVDLARHEHAARAGGRHRDPPARQRARRRHARPRPLGARRHRAARASDGRRDQERRVAAADSRRRGC